MLADRLALRAQLVFPQICLVFALVSFLTMLKVGDEVQMFFYKDCNSGEQHGWQRNGTLYRIRNGRHYRKENEAHYLKNGAAEIKQNGYFDNGKGIGFSIKIIKNTLVNKYLPCR